MKKYILLGLVASAIFTSCKKGPVNGGTTPVEFKSTTYAYIGTYDSDGKPNYLETMDNVSNNMVNFLLEKIPEKSDIRKTNPDLLKNADLPITAKSEVFITFVTEGTGNTNTIGYYTYKTGNAPTKPENISKITYVFPHASQVNSGGSLRPGDKVKIGTIEAGMTIGFVLLQNGWDVNTKKVNDNAPHFLSNRELNPENLYELKPHTVVFNYAAENKTMIGFEDVNRTLPTCDHDFNDVVLYATVNPIN